MVKVKGNKRLFLRIKSVTAQMNLLLPAMVQNDMELDEDEVERYFELWENLEDELGDLYRLVDDWIYGEE